MKALIHWRDSMKKKILLLIAVIFLSLSRLELSAVDQILYFKVPSVSGLGISGNVNFPDFTAPTPGQNFAQLTDSSTTYSLNLNSGVGTRKITGKLAAAAPVGVKVNVTLAPPSGATNAPATALTTSDQTLVSGIGNGLYSSQGITYQLSADMANTPAQAFSVTVTYTLVGGT